MWPMESVAVLPFHSRLVMWPFVVDSKVSVEFHLPFYKYILGILTYFTYCLYRKYIEKLFIRIESAMWYERKCCDPNDLITMDDSDFRKYQMVQLTNKNRVILCRLIIKHKSVTLKFSVQYESFTPILQWNVKWSINDCVNCVNVSSQRWVWAQIWAFALALVQFFFFWERDMCATGWITAKYSTRTSILKQGCGGGWSSIYVHGGGLEFDSYIIPTSHHAATSNVFFQWDAVQCCSHPLGCSVGVFSRLCLSFQYHKNQVCLM